jgi:hypothetical protein
VIHDANSYTPHRHHTVHLNVSPLDIAFPRKNVWLSRPHDHITVPSPTKDDRTGTKLESAEVIEEGGSAWASPTLSAVACPQILIFICERAAIRFKVMRGDSGSALPKFATYDSDIL